MLISLFKKRLLAKLISESLQSQLRDGKQNSVIPHFLRSEKLSVIKVIIDLVTALRGGREQNTTPKIYTLTVRQDRVTDT